MTVKFFDSVLWEQAGFEAGRAGIGNIPGLCPLMAGRFECSVKEADAFSTGWARGRRAPGAAPSRMFG